MQNYCRRCGTEAPSGAKFCVTCGAVIMVDASRDVGASAENSSRYDVRSAEPEHLVNPAMYMKDEPSFFGYLLLPWKRSFDFAGRSGRKEYWAFATVALLGYVVLITVFFGQLVSMKSGSINDVENFIAGAAGIGVLVWWLITLLTGTAVAVRRFHDMDQSGWLYVIFVPFYLLMPYVAWIGLIVIGCISGTRGHNRYGPDPYERSVGEVFA